LVGIPAHLFFTLMRTSSLFLRRLGLFLAVGLLVVAPARAVPTVVEHPVSRSVAANTTVTFSVRVGGGSVPPLSYQWRKDGAAVSGATSSSLVLTFVSAASAGVYSAVVADATGVVLSDGATLSVTQSAYLSNLSVRTTMTPGQILTVGLVATGGAKSLLMRAVGPALAAFGLSDAMEDPRIDLYQSSTKVASNDDWDRALGGSFAPVGAFGLPSGSKDAALLWTLGGAYTLQATGTGGGVLLVEGYDLAGGSTRTRLANLSARNRVGIGDDILIAGFSIGGTGSLRVLLRAVGPSLSSFGVAGFLADTKLDLFDEQGVRIASNDDWNSGLAPIFSSVGAFSLPPGSKDSCTLVILPAGHSYTVQVSGVNGRLGEALVEVYEAP
jgi:hypothetical protein